MRAAERSAASAKEIKTLIKDSVLKVDDGARLVDESGVVLTDIVTSVQKVSDIVAEIAAASLEQSTGIEHVNKAITQMDEMTQQNAALVEEAAAASRSMEEQADHLNRLMTFFKLRVTQGQAAPPTEENVSAQANPQAAAVRESDGNGATEEQPVPEDQEQAFADFPPGVRLAPKTPPRAEPPTKAADQWKEF